MRIAKARRRSGFTLIEIIMAMIIIGIVVLPLLSIFSNSLIRNNAPDTASVLLYLARSKMEKLSNMSFSAVSTEAQASFGGDFSSYKSEVEAHYVSAEALDVSVDPTQTGYKWIKVTATSDDYPNFQIELKSLVTDVSNE